MPPQSGPKPFSNSSPLGSKQTRDVFSFAWSRTGILVVASLAAALALPLLIVSFALRSAYLRIDRAEKALADSQAAVAVVDRRLHEIEVRTTELVQLLDRNAVAIGIKFRDT